MKVFGRMIVSFAILLGVFPSAPLNQLPVLAEEFDFDGTAIVNCLCPSATMENNCGYAGRTPWNYSITLHVKSGFDIDLAEACFNKHGQEDLCCEEPRGDYSGEIARKCPGQTSC
jgi:hypothetical protein